MDAETREQITGIITKMNASGMPRDKIRANLQSIGLPEDDINDLLKASPVATTNADIHAKVAALTAKIESGEHLAPVAQHMEQQAQRVAEVHSAVQEMGDKVAQHEDHFHDITEHVQRSAETMEDIADTMEALYEKHDELHAKVSGIESSVADGADSKRLLLEIRASLNALIELDKKILDTNTRVLMRLK